MMNSNENQQALVDIICYMEKKLLNGEIGRDSYSIIRCADGTLGVYVNTIVNGHSANFHVEYLADKNQCAIMINDCEFKFDDGLVNHYCLEFLYNFITFSRIEKMFYEDFA